MKNFTIVFLFTIFRISNGEVPTEVRSSGVFQLELFMKEITYAKAQEFCKSQNSWLAEIKTQQLQDDVDALMGSLGGWIGGKYTSVNWLWGDRSQIVYENWSRGAKSKLNESGDCIELNWKQEWGKISCYQTRRFICQSVRQAIVILPTRELRFFIDEKKTFTEAAAACQTALENGHLVNLKNNKLDNRTTDELNWRKATAYFLTGGKERVEKEWRWRDGSPVDDDNRLKWGTDEPDGGTSQNCLAKAEKKDWKWADVTCSAPAPYICERDLQSSACSSDICTNRGSCYVSTTQGRSTFRCQCANNFIGRMCEIDACDPNPCSTNADCTRRSYYPYYSCTCFNEYQGDDCEARKYTTIGSCTYHLNQQEIVNAQVASTTCTEDDASLAILASISGINNEIARLYSQGVSFWIGAKKDADWRWYDGTRIDSLASTGTLYKKCLKLSYSSQSTSLVPASCYYDTAGFICEKPVGAGKPCASQPCYNQGTCNNFGCHFKCNCKNGYDGKTCDQNRMTVSIASHTFTAHKGEKLSITLQIETEDFPVKITYCKGSNYQKTENNVITKTTSKFLGPFTESNEGIDCKIEVFTTRDEGYTRKESIRIVVVAPAKVRVTEESVAIPVYVTKVIYCHFSGQPTPEVQWYKGDQPVPRQSPSMRVYQVSSSTYYRLVITTHATEADAGNYTCRATNTIEMAAGPKEFSDEKTTYLRVAIQLLSIDGQPQKIYVEETQLSCKYKANPRPTITWQIVRDYETINISESEQESIFKVLSQSIDDQGTPQEMSTMHVKLVDCLGTVQIKCVAENQFQSQSSVFQLNERVKLLGNRQFIFSKNDYGMTRDSAAKFCANMSAFLATIPDGKTQTFLKKHATPLHYRESSHVGGKAFDEGGSRLWKWPDGSLFYNETKYGSWRSEYGTSVDGAYVAWYYEKPTAGTENDCMHLMWVRQRRWGNGVCSTLKIQSICEKTAQSIPVIQSAQAGNCSASIDVRWKPSTKAVGIKHRIEVTPVEKSSAITPRAVDVVPDNELLHQMFSNLSFATKYNVKIYVCPDYCLPDCHSAEQVVTGTGLPERVRKANVSQEDETSVCAISWTKPVNDFGILSYEITAKSKVVYFSSKELENKTFDDKVQHATLTHLQHSFNASPNRDYAFSVQARTCAGLGKSVATTGNCKTKRAAPSLIGKPKPSSIGEDGSLDISMPPIDETNGPISCLLVVVVSDPESDDTEGHKFDQERLGKASIDAGESQGKEYISLALSPTDLSDRMGNGSDLLLTVGDNSTTSCDASLDFAKTRQRRAVGSNTTFQARNTPLDKNNKVGIVFVTATPLGGGNIAYQSSEMAEYGGSDDPISSIGWIAAVVVGIIVVIIIIVVVMLLLKRRKKKANDERPDRSHVPMESIVPSPNNEPLYANLTNDAKDLRSDTDIPMERLESVYNSLKANKNKGFQEEYQGLKNAAKTIVFPKEAASRASLKKKNRYKNILPYDNTRVKLSGDGSESYINASYIEGCNQPNKFIATQGPLPDTVNDFWRMVVEKNCKIILMLTKCFEKGKKKCEQYWPNPGETKQYGKITVQNQSEASFGSFLDTTLKVSGGGLAGTIHHFQLLKWPDHGFPVTTSGFFRLHGAVSSCQIELRDNAPIVVHCSAGAGRTGAFIAYDYLNDERQNLNRVDVYNCVLSMRKQRVDMVQNCDQYIFVYKLLLEDYLFGSTQINGSKAASILREPDVEARISEEFNNLSLMEPIHTELHGAHQEIMNRKKNLVPYEHAKVVITRVEHELDTPYINASFVETYNDSYAMIAAQGPVEASIENFWRAAFDNDVTIIVALTRCTEGNKEQCSQYWPMEVGESMRLQHISVEMRTQYLDGNIVIREMHVTKEKETKKIMQYHYKGWSAASCPSNPTEILDLVNKMQKAIHPRGKLTVLVHCSDGAGRAGAFCAIVNLIERLNSENVVDVFREAKDLRDCRPGMVQTPGQYRFCYQTIETYMAATSVYSNFDVGNEEKVYENL